MADRPYVLDSITGLVLWMGVWIAFQALRATRTASRRFWVVMTAAFAYLAADEWVGFHEWVGRTLIRDVPFLNTRTTSSS
jgi:uncharacterized membrane protein